MRWLTTKFTTYKIDKYESATGKGVLDLVNIGNFEVNKIARLIKLGNSFPKGSNEDEEAYKKLDDYLAMDEEHSLVSAFFDLIGELDMDLKILRAVGVSVAELRDEFAAEVANKVALVKEKEHVVAEEA